MQTLQGRSVHGQFGLRHRSGDVTLVSSWTSYCLPCSYVQCTGSWFQAFVPATANARVSKCMAEELTTRSPRVSDRSFSTGFLLGFSLSVTDGRDWLTWGQRCRPMTVPVHAVPGTTWTARALRREASGGGLVARAWCGRASWRLAPWLIMLLCCIQPVELYYSIQNVL